MMRIPSFIYLYDGDRTKSLDIEKISRYLKGIFKKSRIIKRDDFLIYAFSKLSPDEKNNLINTVAKKTAETKITDINNRNLISDPLYGEIEYEKKIIANRDLKSSGVLYSGFDLINIFAGQILQEEFNLKSCHILFTNRLFGTWDEEDLKYHARVGVYGFPSIISVTGIVEAPAKPREFYLKQQMGVDIESLKREFSGRFIDYDDPRLTEVMKGYTMQAIFFHMTGNPFCDNKDCRLFNAHWQEEVIRAQLYNKNEFCPEHHKSLNYIKNI